MSAISEDRSSARTPLKQSYTSTIRFQLIPRTIMYGGALLNGVLTVGGGIVYATTNTSIVQGIALGALGFGFLNAAKDGYQLFATRVRVMSTEESMEAGALVPYSRIPNNLPSPIPHSSPMTSPIKVRDTETEQIIEQIQGDLIKILSVLSGKDSSKLTPLDPPADTKWKTLFQSLNKLHPAAANYIAMLTEVHKAIIAINARLDGTDTGEVADLDYDKCGNPAPNSSEDKLLDALTELITFVNAQDISHLSGFTDLLRSPTQEKDGD